ncbi:CMGA protein, partial [Atractosteus spatula]|nr:CMGA protein [Atractosteus spatula]
MGPLRNSNLKELQVTTVSSCLPKQVMKCIVEVIADTLSKPSPIPISQECLDSLRGDERIISILRHQNLLKELQELASQGASERAQQQKKGDHLEDQIPAVLEDALDKDVPADQSMLDALKKPASYKETRRVDLREQALPAQKREAELSENEVEESEESDGESREGNEVEEPKEEEKREGGPEKLIPASLSPEEEKASVGTEGSKEEEMQLKSRETSKPVSKEGGEDIESDGVFQGKAEGEENETEKEDSSEADKDGSRTDAATSVPEVHKVKNSLQGEGGDQEEQTEEKRSSEEEEEDEEEKCCQEGEEGGEADDQEGEKNGEDSKRWSRMDELAEKLSSRKRSQGEMQEEEEERSAESSQTSRPEGLLTRDLQRHRHAAQHHSKEDSSQEERSRAQETVAHSEADERREEEGSASRKAEVVFFSLSFTQYILRLSKL